MKGKSRLFWIVLAGFAVLTAVCQSNSWPGGQMKRCASRERAAPL